MKNQLLPLLFALLLPASAYLQNNPIVLSTNVTHVSCFGGSNGAIDLTATGGASSLTYTWSNGSTTQDQNNLPAGVYTPTVTDANGQSATIAVLVCQPPPILIDAVVIPTVPNECFGSITLSVSGGNAPYTFQWSSGNIGPVIDYLCAGTYSVTVTDSYGCTATEPFFVSGNYTVPIFHAQVTNATCSDSCNGQVNFVDFSGFADNYLFNWFATNGESGAFTGPELQVYNLCPGDSVTVFVSGPNGYQSVLNAQVGFDFSQTDITIHSENAALCNIPGQQSCERVCPNAVVRYFITTGSDACPGNIYKFWNVAGAKSWELEAGNNSVLVTWGETGAGSVGVTLSLFGVCFGPPPLCVQIIPEPSAKFEVQPAAQSADTIQICAGQTIWFQNTSTGADQALWLFTDDASTSNADNTSHLFALAGTYETQLIARNNCGCADTTKLTVVVLSSPSVGLDCVNTSCPGETITYTANSDCSQLQWTVVGGNVLSGGGTADTSVTIQWLDAPETYISILGQSCGGLSCPEPTVHVVPVLSDNAEIKGAELVCLGDEEYYEIGPFDGAGIVWSVNYAGTILEGQGRNKVRVRWSNLSAQGFLAVEYYNCYLGCSGRDTIFVKVRDPFGIKGPLEVCAGAAATYKAQTIGHPGGVNISCNWTLTDENGSAVWTSPSPSNQAAITFAFPPGTYRLNAIPTASNQNFTCSPRAEWTVFVRPIPAQPTGISGPGYFCPNQMQTYTANGITPGGDVLWTIKTGSWPTYQDNGNPMNVTFQPGGTSWLEAVQVSTDGLGCLSTPVHLNVQQMQGLPAGGTPTACVNTDGFYSAPALAGFSYQWSVVPADAGVIYSGQGTSNIAVSWEKAGNHTVQLAVCGQNSQVAVQVWPEPVPAVTAPAGACQGATVLAAATASWSAYAWKDSLGNTLSTAPTLQLPAGDYALVASDNHGCSGTATFNIEEYPIPNVSLSTTDPTGFCNNSRDVHMTALVEADGDFDFEWFQDGISLGNNQPLFSTNQYGNFTVEVTNQYGCKASDGPILVFEYCGGVCHNPNHPPVCPPGSFGIDILPTARCDSFAFQLLAGPDFVPGSQHWIFGKSGSIQTGESWDPDPEMIFPNAGKYVVFLFGELTNGAHCLVVDSLDVEAYAQLAVLQYGCSGSPIDLQDESTFLPGGSISSWSWNFGDPASGNNTSTLRMPSHQYNAPGQYPLTLTVTASSGCTSSATGQVRAYPAPDPVFTLPAQGCENNAMPFGWTGSGGISAWQWDFYSPAGLWQNGKKGQQVWQTFASPGDYPVKLTLENITGCSASFTDTVTVIDNLLSGNILPATYIGICEGQTQTLTAPPGGAAYHWSTGASGSSINVSQEGVYKVTVTDAQGCTFVPSPRPVYVFPAPEGVIKAILYDENDQVSGISYPGLEICDKEKIHLTVQDNGSYDITWTTGATSTNLIFSLDHSNLPGPGLHTYTATLTDSYGCTAVLAPFEVQVNPIPDGFNASADQFCAGTPSTVQLNGTLQPGWQVFWNNGATGPAFSTTAEGHYFARVVNQFGCAGLSNTVDILPGPNLAAIPGGCHTRCRPDTLCVPAMPDIISWQWYFEGAPIPGANSPGLVAANSGAYWVEMTDNSGCTAQSSPLNLELYDGFGNVQGTVWADVNHNGLIDAADTLVNGIQLQIFQNGVTAGIGTSGAAGTVFFSNLPAAQYTVEIDPALLPAGWTVVAGLDSASLSGCDHTIQTEFLLDISCAAPGALDLYACPGTTVSYNGTDVAAGSSLAVHLSGWNGCDSLLTVTAHALIGSAQSIQASACAGSSFDYNGTLIPAGSSQQFTLTGFNGCDSILTVAVNAIAPTIGSLQASACAGTSFDYNGTLIPAGSSQQFTLTGFNGCDSIVTVVVNAIAPTTGSLQASACAGTSFDYNGTLIPAGSSQQFVFTGFNGCDSILTVAVNAIAPTTGSLQASACTGSSFNYNGTLIPAGSSQQFTLTGFNGCDSILTVTVNAIFASSGSLQASACAGSSFDYYGTLIPAGSSQLFMLTGYHGCDSILTVMVNAIQPTTGILQASACAGSSFDYNGTLIPAGSSQQFTLTGYHGCDSILTVTVNTIQPTTGILQASACAGISFDYNGTLIPAGSSQQFTLTGVNGCDSLLTVAVAELPVYANVEVYYACPGGFYDYHGTAIASETEQVFHFTANEGCDSLVTVRVLAWPAVDFDFIASKSCAQQATGALAVQPVSGTAPWVYALDGAVYQPDSLFENLAPGAYQLQVKDGHDCRAAQTLEIAEYGELSALLGNAVLPCEAQQVELQPQLAGDLDGLTVQWWNGDTTLSTVATEPGLVWVEVGNVCATLRREAEVLLADIAGDTSLVYMPNVLKPDAADVANREFRPHFATGVLVLDYRLEVFDRWGNLVFATDNYTQGWDSRFRAKDAQTSVFVAKLEARVEFCGREMRLKKYGDVTVLR